MSWDSFCKSVKKTAEKAADEINYSAELATMQVKLSMAEKKLEEAYAELGKAAYRHFCNEESTADAVAHAMEPVEAAMKEVRSWKLRIEKLKKEHAREKNAEDAPQQSSTSEEKADQEP